MILVGCDFHSRYQQIACVDTDTGDLIERRLEHENGEPERSIVACDGRRVSVLRHTGNLPWFGRMLAELGHELMVGGAAKIRAMVVRRQKTRRQTKQEKSKREGFVAYVSDRLHAVKWRNWKMHLIWQVNMYDPPLKLPLPKVINLLTDLKEERDLLVHDGWVAHPMTKLLNDVEESLKKYPPIPMGTPDPYHPPNHGSAERQP